jgi:hypothetical protein
MINKYESVEKVRQVARLKKVRQVARLKKVRQVATCRTLGSNFYFQFQPNR